MFDFQAEKKQYEQEGVFIGGYSLKHILLPKRRNGVHDSSEDRIANVSLDQDWTAEEERSLVRKLDRRVLFPACICYFLAYLDRANIGNVKILQAGTEANISERLHLHGTQFNWAVSITYFPVVLFLMPSNLLVKATSAKTYLPIAAFLWGSVVMCIATSKNSSGLFASRFFLGVPESGVVPACLYYFTFWYKPTERAWRIGIFHSANALASGVSGFLAVGIDHLNGKGGLDSWQWVFIIEGAMSVVCSVGVYFLLLTFPETSTALSDRQRHIAVKRLAIGASRKTDVTWEWSAFVRLMTRPSTYLFFISYICLTIVATAQGTFGPTILNKFAGYSPRAANAYMGIVYFYTIPLYWVVSYHSDWTRERMWHYVFLLFGVVPCYGVWTYVSVHKDFGGISPIALYGMCYLGHLVSVAQPVALSYRTSTLYGAAEGAVGSASIIAALYTASIISPQMYPDKDAPWFLKAFMATDVILAVCMLSYLILPIVLLLEARQRKKKYGFAMPLRAMVDAEHSEATVLTVERIRENKFYGSEKGDIDSVHHVERVDYLGRRV